MYDVCNYIITAYVFDFNSNFYNINESVNHAYLFYKSFITL